jgi:thiosulfate/3-mercaptopyruvate sulfurtransferase
MNQTYAHPERLVSTEWVAQYLDDPHVRIVETNEDALLYATGHIPGAVHVDWFVTLQDPVQRDFIDKPSFEQLCSSLGIANDTKVVFYGDKSNWFACYAFWLFEHYGHQDLCIMDGGRAKWTREGRPTSKEVPTYPKTAYKASEPDMEQRAFRDDVLKHIESSGALVDVRSPMEYAGNLLHMQDYPQEGAMRGGHIPGAVNIPWSQATNEDGTFKDPESLALVYQEQGLSIDDEVITYCRIGERSSHTWFTLKYLLGFPRVKNYDGSWTEWGNLVGVPIEK